MEDESFTLEDFDKFIASLPLLTRAFLLSYSDEGVLRFYRLAVEYNRKNRLYVLAGHWHYGAMYANTGSRG